MTNPYATPEWQAWSGPAAKAAPGVSGGATSIGTEAVVAMLVATYSIGLGAVMGLVWPRLAPHVQFIRAINGSEAAAKALLGDDMWFALLGGVAGVLSVAILLLVARDAGRGPGGLLGLAIGGVLASLVAAHIGHHVQQPHIVQQPHLVETLRHLAPGITQRQIDSLLGLFAFKVRANVVLLAWPIAAVITHAISIIARYLRLGPEA